MERWGYTRVAALASVLLLMPLGPADARTFGEFNFLGNRTTPGGFGYPCTVADVPGNVPGCLLAFTVAPPDIIPTGGRTSPAQTQSIGCEYDGFTFGKSNKPAKETGECTLTLSGTETGYCGLSYESGTGILDVGNGLPTMPSRQTFELEYRIYRSRWHERVEGTWRKVTGGQTGKLRGTTKTMEISGSCTNNTATGWSIAGLVVMEDLLP